MPARRRSGQNTKSPIARRAAPIARVPVNPTFNNLPEELRQAVLNRVTNTRGATAVSKMWRHAIGNQPHTRTNVDPTHQAVDQILFGSGQQAHNAANRLRRLVSTGSRVSQNTLNRFVRVGHGRLSKKTFEKTLEEIRKQTKMHPTAAATTNVEKTSHLRHLHSLGIPVGNDALLQNLENEPVNNTNHRTHILRYRLQHGTANHDKVTKTVRQFWHDQRRIAEYAPLLEKFYAKASTGELYRFALELIRGAEDEGTLLGALQPIAWILGSRRDGTKPLTWLLYDSQFLGSLYIAKLFAHAGADVTIGFSSLTPQDIDLLRLYVTEIKRQGLTVSHDQVARLYYRALSLYNLYRAVSRSDLVEFLHTIKHNFELDRTLVYKHALNHMNILKVEYPDRNTLPAQREWRAALQNMRWLLRCLPLDKAQKKELYRELQNTSYPLSVRRLPTTVIQNVNCSRG